jgi:hypothetical protein
MSAEVLRQAASLMRERATECLDESVGLDEESWYRVKDATDLTVWTKWAAFAQCNLTDAEHIASWHPVVALAVATMLDGARCGLHCDADGKRSPYCSACEDSGCDHECPDRVQCKHTRGYTDALAVARAYLGSDA